MTENTTPTPTLPHSYGDIVARIKELEQEPNDPWGVEPSRLLEALPWSHAQAFMGQGSSDESAWEAAASRLRTPDQVRARILEYLPLAWAKANAQRGVEIHRAMAHFRGLLWLLKEDDMRFELEKPMGQFWDYYGKPQLVRLSELMGHDWKGADDENWWSLDDVKPPVRKTSLEVIGR